MAAVPVLLGVCLFLTRALTALSYLFDCRGAVGWGRRSCACVPSPAARGPEVERVGLPRRRLQLQRKDWRRRVQRLGVRTPRACNPCYKVVLLPSCG